MKHHSQKLYTLMEESPPPVPPKDTHYTTTMNAERPASAHASASKRKRDTLDVTSYDENGEDQHTPKRRRSPLPQSDIEADASDETTPAYQKNLRRKKGSRNLSNLNLRHAAEKQKAQGAKVKSRKSRFVEGSMNDKPSEKPPSMFMRFIRTESGNIKQVTAATEDLMEDYHDEMARPRDSVEKVIAQEKAAVPSRVAGIESEKENNGGGMFGRWASSFHPVALWNKVFSQTRDEMIREEFEAAERKAREEAERKAREKAEIEAQYAQMKAAGMFKPKYLSPVVGSVSSRKTVQTQRDSGIVIDEEASVHESEEHGPDEEDEPQAIEPQEQEHSRAASGMSGRLVPPQPQDDTTSASDVPETASKPAKTLKSRLHLKKPSLTNIQGSLKRAKSDFSLTQTLHHRESSSSISPIKTDFENSALKKSQSKHDLKNQTKLSKRVSDLESKLSQARRELDEALVDASPMPKLGNKYERFTPQSTLKRPKFIPGRLPSLPSERVLMEQQARENEMKMNEVKAIQDTEMNDLEEDDTRDADLNEFLAEAKVNNIQDDDEGEGEETIKARAPHNRRQYPTRASSLFSLNNTNIEQPSQQATESTESVRQSETVSTSEAIEKDAPTSDLTEIPTSQVDDMDPNSISNFTSNGMVDTATKPDYAALDAKLKALDANVKTSKKSQKSTTKTKKRKSGAHEEDKEYKPGKSGESEDSAWEEEQTPKKKRKSSTGLASSPKDGKEGNKNSPSGKKSKKAPASKKNAKKTTSVVETTQVEEYSADERADGNDAAAEGAGDIEMPSARSSLDSLQMRPLEPVMEEADEEEEVADETTTTNIPLNNEPSKPTAKATPARHSALNGHAYGARSRSASPNKRPAIGAEEQMITRAAEAARNNPARSRASSRSVSPLPSAHPRAKGINGHTHANAGAEVEDEPVRIIPGEGGVPAMPRGKKEGKQAAGKDGDFEWPDDVF